MQHAAVHEVVAVPGAVDVGRTGPHIAFGQVKPVPIPIYATVAKRQRPRFGIIIVGLAVERLPFRKHTPIGNVEAIPRTVNAQRALNGNAIYNIVPRITLLHPTVGRIVKALPLRNSEIPFLFDFGSTFSVFHPRNTIFLIDRFLERKVVFEPVGRRTSLRNRLRCVLFGAGAVLFSSQKILQGPFFRSGSEIAIGVSQLCRFDSNGNRWRNGNTHCKNSRNNADTYFPQHFSPPPLSMSLSGDFPFDFA